MANDQRSYTNWKKEVHIWLELSDLPVHKRALKLFSALGGPARKVASELEIAELKSNEGVQLLFQKLDSLYLGNESPFLLKAYRELYNLRRPRGENILPFIDEFEDKYSKLNDQGVKLQDKSLAMQLLASACVHYNEIGLIMSSMEEVTYSGMKTALKIILSAEGYQNIAPRGSRGKGKKKQLQTRGSNQTESNSTPGEYKMIILENMVRDLFVLRCVYTETLKHVTETEKC